MRTWSAHLSWPDASAALDVALRSGDADERAHGYALLVEAARRSRDPRAVAEVIVRLGRLRNEQDPVRAAALTALARVAPLLTVGTAAGLTQLTIDAVDARDSSAATTTALSSLAVGVLQHHVAVPQLREWALFAIDLVSAGAAVPVLRRFDTVLRNGQETMVFDRLRGWVEAGMTRGRYGPLFALTRAFGRRAWRLPQLQGLLRRAIGPRTLPSVARTAIGLWLDDPRTRAERVAEVLDVDASAVTIHEVWATICAFRTDLPDRVLERRPDGRFVEPGTRWVPAWTLQACPTTFRDPRFREPTLDERALVRRRAAVQLRARRIDVRRWCSVPSSAFLPVSGRGPLRCLAHRRRLRHPRRGRTLRVDRRNAGGGAERNLGPLEDAALSDLH